MYPPLVQYLSDIGLLVLLNYFLRTQAVVVNNAVSNPARLATSVGLQALTGIDVPDPTDAIFGLDTLLARISNPYDMSIGLMDEILTWKAIETVIE